MKLAAPCRNCGTDRTWEIIDGQAILADAGADDFPCGGRRAVTCAAPSSVLQHAKREGAASRATAMSHQAAVQRHRRGFGKAKR